MLIFLFFYNIRQSMIKLPEHSGFHVSFLNYSTWNISSPAAVALLYHAMQGEASAEPFNTTTAL
jgi:hypothetical protein